MNLWYCLSSILLLYNLMILIGERKLAVFNKQRDFKTKNKYGLCFSIDELISRDKLIKNEIYTPKQMIDTLVNSTLNGNEENLNISSSFIQQDHVCIDIKLTKFHQIFSNISTFKFQILINPFKANQIDFFENIYTHNQLKKGNFYLKLDLFIVKFLPNVYGTNCTLKRNDDKTTKTYIKFECLSDCYKSYANSTSFHYHYAEKVELKVELKLNRINKTIANEYCLSKCNEEDCFLRLFFKYMSFEEQSKLPIIEIRNHFIEAFPILNPIDLIIQLLALIVLFLNISLFEIVIILIKILKAKLTASRRLLINFNYLYYAVLAICILLLTALTAYYIKSYLKSIYLVRHYYEDSKEFIPFSLFICLPVQLAYLNKSDQLKLANERIFAKKTFLEIEKDTSIAFSDLIENSYLKKGGINVSFAIEKENDTIFKSEAFLGEKSLLTRCFRIDLNIREHKYESIMAFTQLILDLKYFDFKIYFTDYKHSLTSNQTHTCKRSTFYISKKSRLNCLNYTGHCRSKSNCIDYCYNELYYKNHSSISTKSVIYKSHFKRFDLSNAHFDGNEDKAIRNHCILAYQARDCKLLKLKEWFQHIKNQSAPNQLKIELYLFKEFIYEFEEISFAMTLLNLLNFESMLLGVNAKKVFNFLIGLLKKISKNKYLKLYAFLLLLFSLTGFLMHSSFIFFEILTSPLVKSESFEKLNSIPLSDFIICLEIDLSQFDSQLKSTGKYLDQLTSNLTFQSIFDHFTLLDEKMNQLSIEANDLKSNNDKIKVSHFFLYNMKCFNFQTDIVYALKDLLKLDDIFAIKIYFKESIYLTDSLEFYVAFFDKNKGSFDKLEHYYFEKDTSLNITSTFVMQPVMLSFSYTDKFYYFQSPLSFFKVNR